MNTKVENAFYDSKIKEIENLKGVSDELQEAISIAAMSLNTLAKSYIAKIKTAPEFKTELENSFLESANKFKQALISGVLPL